MAPLRRNRRPYMLALAALAAFVACAHNPPATAPSCYLNATQLERDVAAVLVVDDGQTIDTGLTLRLAQAIGGRDGVFTPAFVAEDLFARAHGGDGQVLRELGIDRVASSVVLALVVRSRAAPERVADQPVIRAETELSVRVFQLREGLAGDGFAERGTGAGFSEAEAHRNADEAAVTKLVARLGGGA